MGWGLAKRVVEGACGLVMIVASLALLGSLVLLLLFFVTSFYAWSGGVAAADAVHPAQMVEHGQVRYITANQSAAVHSLELALFATALPAVVGLLLALGIQRLLPSDDWAFGGLSVAPGRRWRKTQTRRRTYAKEDAVKTT